MKYLLIVLAVAFAMPSMAEEDAPQENDFCGEESRSP